MSRKNNCNYFETFVELEDYSCKAAGVLNGFLHDFDEEKLAEIIVTMHEIEHAADLSKHEMMNKLAKEFITPLEREDIVAMAQEIDDVTDAIEDVLLRMYMFRVHSVREKALAFVDIIVRCCEELKLALQDFHNFRKPTGIQEHIVEINRLEEVGDALYTRAVYDLYDGSTPANEVMAWTEVFHHMEMCCDSCEDVAEVMESVIMRNS